MRSNGMGAVTKVRRAALLAATVFVVLAASSGGALAQGPVNPLDNMHERLQKAVEWQANYLEVAERVAERTREWIAQQTEKGRDTSELKETLEAFEEGLAKAKDQHAEAVAALDSGEGFDESGKVVDRVKAFETMVQVARALGEAQRALWSGMMELRAATGDWRRFHRSWQRDG